MEKEKLERTNTFFLNDSLRKFLSSRGSPLYRRERGYHLVGLLTQKHMIPPCVPFLMDRVATIDEILKSIPPDRLAHYDGLDHPE